MLQLILCFALLLVPPVAFAQSRGRCPVADRNKTPAALDAARAFARDSITMLERQISHQEARVPIVKRESASRLRELQNDLRGLRRNLRTFTTRLRNLQACGGGTARARPSGGSDAAPSVDSAAD